MNMKPVKLLVVTSAVSLAALSGCGSLHAAGDDAAAPDSAAAPAAAPADSAQPAPAPAPADNAAASAPANPAPAAEVSAAPPQPLVADGTLKARVKAALAKHYGLGAAHINVSTREGVVHLSGAVGSSVQIDQAQYVVSEVDGVLEIDNQLKVAHPQK